jgi:DNA modification methylase
MPAEELLFDSTPGFGRYKSYMEQAIAHPAKMNTRLLEFLIKTHTKKGDVVLDPMAGSGSTGVISALNGRNAVCVELEEKFFGWMEEARKKVESYSNLSDKGKVINIKGDARQLSNLVQNADLVLTSPPYGEAQQGQGIAKYGYQGTKHSPTDLVGKRSYMPDKFESKDNISRLSMGNIDAVITSPPYAERSEHKLGYDYEKRDLERGHQPYKGFREQYSENPDNIAHLKHGEVDAVITSPPYADAKKGGEADEAKMAERWDKTAKDRNWNSWGKTWKTEGRKRALKSLGSGYSKEKDNIGNLDFVDSVITSPPYEQSLEGGTRHYQKGGGHFKIIDDKNLPTAYSFQNANQIGNLKKETYLEAMFSVYSEMWKVLKPEGSAIIIIKPFIRNKKVADLPWHTWLLLEKVGFKLIKLYKLRLKQDSFWRVLYTKKYPAVPQIKHEYVIVCQKSHLFTVNRL